MTNELAAARERLEAARAALSANRNAETMVKFKAAWNAVEALTPRRPVSNYASRAGKRQASERRALSTRRR
jgi:hypothetical protein